MKLNLRLKPKITLGTLLILFTCLFVVSAIFLNREQNRLEQEIRNQGLAFANLVAKFCVTPIKKYSYFIVQEVARNVEQAKGVAFCEVYDADGRSLVEVDVTLRGEKIINNPRRTGDDILIIETPVRDGPQVLGKVEIGFELAPVQKRIWEYIVRLVIVVLVVLALVGVSINAFLSYHFISPVVNLSEAVKNVARGEFVETRIEQRHDEIGDLARAFNHMSKNLRQLYYNLEKKVLERTADLAQTNTLLKNEIRMREQVEQDLKSAKEAAEKANQYKSNFVANMSHEIRTPLNAILGYAQILQAKSELDEPVRKAVEAIDKSGSHLLGLINDILDFSKIEAGRMELKTSAFDLSQLIRNLASMFYLRCKEKNLSWEVVGLDTEVIVPVVADAGKLRQILINLLGNAVKFTTEGGVVLRVEPKGGVVYRFCIEDTGPGVPESLLKNVFEPFTELSGTSGKEGTGLGLSITAKYLEMMNSSLEVERNEPVGTKFCFEIELPAAEKSSVPVEKAASRIVGLVTEQPLTALIVDDDKLSRAMLIHLLNKAEIRTLEAENGLQALKKLEQKKADIIFMDRYMPEMDGAETIENIKRQYGAEAPPVVLITAAAFDSNAEIQEQLGVEGIIIKPCNIEQVIECMAHVLGLSLKLEESLPAIEDSENIIDIKRIPKEELSLPSSLHQRLKSAAEFGKIHELKVIAAELDSTPGVSQSIALLLKKHLESYQLDEILDLMERITVT